MAGFACTTAQVVEKFRNVHEDLYDYSKVDYVGSRSNVIIICKVHGEFNQTPTGHLSGKGCRQCSVVARGKKKLQVAKDKFLSRCRATHGDRYDYSETEYLGTDHKVKIICRVHGAFEQYPTNHIKGHHCSKCANEDVGPKLRTDWETLLSQFEARHGDFYSYPNKEHSHGQTTITIVCPEHGPFEQKIRDHLRGRGCPVCRYIKSSSSLRATLCEVINSFTETHGDKYDYAKVVYKNNIEKVEIICPIHGSFWQSPCKHSAPDANNCPMCSPNVSQPEIALGDYLESLGLEVVRSDREIIGPRKELDIYLPEKKIAIEYNGLIWHSEKFKTSDAPHINPARRHMLEKQRLCAAKGVRLIHVASDSPIEVVKATLKNTLGLNPQRVYARKCLVKNLSKVYSSKVDKFLNDHHLQGAIVNKPYTYGLEYEGDLVAVMCFSKPVSRRGKNFAGMYELRRYSAICRIPGGASRLLKAFLKDHPEATGILSFSDNAWFDGSMYEALGFTKDAVLDPDYRYVSGEYVYPKNHFTKTRMQKREGFIYDDSLTERENARNNSFFRIFDCGKTRWILNPNK